MWVLTSFTMVLWRVSTEPQNESTTLVQLSTPLRRGARPVRISRSQGHRCKQGNNAQWELSLLAGVLVGVVHDSLELLVHCRGHDILGGLEYRLEVEMTVNGQRLGRRAVPHEH